MTNLPALLSAPPLQDLTRLSLRIALAVPFFRSGLTKWDDWFVLSDSARWLFAEEFRLHLFGAEVAYPLPGIAALLSGVFEIALPVLLVLGLGTRVAALGLLGMTAVIQLTVPDGWANFHLPWAAMALAVACFGPGRFALDAAVGTAFANRRDAPAPAGSSAP
jgi:putative oxidoreductase